MLLYTSLMFGDIEPSHADTDYSKSGEERKHGKATLHLYCRLFPLICNQNKDSVLITVLLEAVSYSVNLSGVKA